MLHRHRHYTMCSAGRSPILVALCHLAQRSDLDSRYNIEGKSPACSCSVHIATQMAVFRKRASSITGHTGL
jgi:hypothetical protein